MKGQPLLHIQHQPFQVFSFGMIDVDGMVGWLMQLMQDANLPLCHGCRREDCHSELVFVDGLRAAEGEEDAARLYHLECLAVELRVASQGITERVFMFGKSRRVEDDEVIDPL